MIQNIVDIFVFMQVNRYNMNMHTIIIKLYWTMQCAEVLFS